MVKNPNKNISINLRLPFPIWKFLKEYAHENDVSMNNIIVGMICDLHFRDRKAKIKKIVKNMKKDIDK